MSRKTNVQENKVVSTSKTFNTKSSLDMNWRDQKTAEQCLSHLCLSEHLSDISFTFKGDKNVTLSAHKFVLSMRSAVFETMFYCSLAEGGDTVSIEDVEPETMRVLLRFMYSDKPGLNGKNVLSSLYAAKKYALTGLVKQCSEFLENNIDTNNVCSIHEQAVFYDMKCLQEKCFDYILENASCVFSTQGFLQISHDTLLNLLKQDETSIDEENVFNAAVKWSKNKSKAKQLSPDAKNLRECLGDALFEIRFPVMPIQIFATVVTPTGILSSEEQITLYQFNATKGSSPLGKFVSRERSGSAIKIDVTQYTRSQYRSRYNGAQYEPECFGQKNKPDTEYNCECFEEQYKYVLQIQCRHNNRYDSYGIKSLSSRQLRKKASLKVKSITGQYKNGYDSCGVEGLSSSMPGNEASLKVRSITGKFVKYVERITVGDTPYTNFRTVGKKITFQNPIEMSNGDMIEFHVDDSEGCVGLEEIPVSMSYQTNIQEYVNGQMVGITWVPVGTETISFAKQ